jgi:hypothetical protein
VGVCGKGGQSVPAGVGQPTLLVEGLTVGGTADAGSGDGDRRRDNRRLRLRRGALAGGGSRLPPLCLPLQGLPDGRAAPLR